MIPTAKFRWLEVPLDSGSRHPSILIWHGTTGRVLQQWWWTDNYERDGEWRDIPIEAQP